MGAHNSHKKHRKHCSASLGTWFKILIHFVQSKKIYKGRGWEMYPHFGHLIGTCVSWHRLTHIQNNNKYNSFIRNNSYVIIHYNAIFKVWGNRLYLLRERGKILSFLNFFYECKMKINNLTLLILRLIFLYIL